METGLALIILGEVIFTLFLVWGWMNEDRFIAFETRIAKNVRRRIRYYKKLFGKQQAPRSNTRVTASRSSAGNRAA